MDYQKELDIYISDVIDIIYKQVIARLDRFHNTTTRYTYYFSSLPQLPHIISKTKIYFYKNDYDNVYPVKQIFEGLIKKFPNFLIKFDEIKTGIIIEWNENYV